MLSDCIFEILVTANYAFANSDLGCELLSDCIFEILVTAIPLTTALSETLWIAFRLYLWNIGHSSDWYTYSFCCVVNCFQIVSLKYWSQHLLFLTIQPTCCELLSDCIFEILVTALNGDYFEIDMLWIAFRLYLWNIGHSPLRI